MLLGIVLGKRGGRRGDRENVRLDEDLLDEFGACHVAVDEGLHHVFLRFCVGLETAVDDGFREAAWLGAASVSILVVQRMQ